MRPTRRHFLATAAALTARGAHAANTQKPAAPPPLVIGAALPLSGNAALTGDECLRGIELAAATGKPLNLVSADAFDQSQAAAAVNGLINNLHAGLLLGSGTSELSFPGSAAAELAQVPYIELNAAADGITSRGFKFLLRTGPTTSMVAALAADTLSTRFQGRKIGLLFNTGATTGAIAGGVIAALNTRKIPVRLAIGYPEDVTDLADPAGRLMRAGAEIVLHAAGPLDALAFYAAMQAQNWRPKSVLGCGDGYLLRETAAALGPAFDDTLAIGAPFYPPQAAGIAAAYLSRFGTEPRAPDSLSAYVGAKLVFDALNANAGDPAKLLASLRKTSLPAGSLANGWGVAFDRNGQNTAAFVTLQRWRSGKLFPEK